MNNNIDLSKFVISRFDTYYNGVNTKCNFYLALNTFLIGGTITAYGFLFNKVALNDFHRTMLVIIVIIALTGIAITLFAVQPYLHSGNSKKYQSLFFFDSISSMKEKEFCEEFNAMSPQKIAEDLSCQSYQLALGLHAKFRYLKWVGNCLGINFLVIVILAISIITQLK